MQGTSRKLESVCHILVSSNCVITSLAGGRI